jgi:phosphoglycolate phosphatase
MATMLPPFDAMLFDFDGTLAVLNLDFAQMRRRVIELAGTYSVAAELLQGMYILEMVEYASTLLRQRASDRGDDFYRRAHQLIQDIEVEAAYGSALLPGVPALLDTLRQRRIGVGIVTRNCAAAVRHMFPEVEQYCQAFLPRDHVTQVKPHPGHLQAALTCLGSAPDRTIMVGDGVLDIQAGKALGMFSVGVLSGETSRDQLVAQGADLVLASAADLLPYLRQRWGMQP